MRLRVARKIAKSGWAGKLKWSTFVRAYLMVCRRHDRQALALGILKRLRHPV